MPHLKVICQELSRDVPPYPTKNAYLNFPNPKAFYMNYCSQLTFFYISFYCPTSLIRD